MVGSLPEGLQGSTSPWFQNSLCCVHTQRLIRAKSRIICTWFEPRKPSSGETHEWLGCLLGGKNTPDRLPGRRQPEAVRLDISGLMLSRGFGLFDNVSGTKILPPSQSLPRSRSELRFGPAPLLNSFPSHSLLQVAHGFS